MTKATFELTWHQLDAVVVAELQAGIDRLFVLEKDAVLDQRSLDAHLCVLEKYMGMTDHAVYSKQILTKAENETKTP